MIYITHSGTKIDITKFSKRMVNLDDIAHHLTKTCRYGGALPLNVHYSVAEHSILLARYALKHHGIEIARAALLHDAAEAYLGDIISGLKKLLPDYRNIEFKVENIIKEKYKIHNDHTTELLVKTLDIRILIDESEELLSNQSDLFKKIYKCKGLNVKIKHPKNLQLIKNEFLKLCGELKITDGGGKNVSKSKG